MNDLFFMIVFFLVSALFLLFGVLSLVWPNKETRLRDWLARSDRWSKPNPDWKPGIQLEKRFAGLIATVFGLLVIRIPILWFLHPKPLKSANPPPPVGSGPGISALIAAGVIMAAGLYLVVRPEPTIRRIVRNHPQRLYPNDMVSRGVWAIRLFGVVAMIVGVCLSYLFLRTVD